VTSGGRAGRDSTVADCRVIELRRITDQRGNLTVVEAEDTIPFRIARVYWLYDVPGGASRAGHAHRELEQFLVAATGSFTVTVDDGSERRSFFLNRSYYGLYVPALIWREVVDFSSGSVCLSIVSAHYDESDYFRDYDEFVAFRDSDARSLP